MNTEIAYIGHDNVIDVQLRDEGIVVDLSAVTRVTLDFNGTVIDSDIHIGVFDWTAGNGVLNIALQGQNIATHEHYQAQLVVYDPDNINGIVWGDMSIVVNE